MTVIVTLNWPIFQVISYNIVNFRVISSDIRVFFSSVKSVLGYLTFEEEEKMYGQNKDEKFATFEASPIF